MGVDPEDVVDIAFEPAVVVLSPARREIIRADVRGGRPWFGQPKPAGALVQPRSRRAAGDGDVRPAAADRPLAHLAARSRHRRRRSSRVVLSTVADRLVDEAGVDDALHRPGPDPARRRRRGGRVRDAQRRRRQGRRRQHRAGRRRRAGRPVLVGQRRRAPGHGGDRRVGGLRLRPSPGRPLPGALHRRRLRRAVVPGVADVRRRHRHRGRGRRHRGAGGPRDRRPPGQRHRQGRRRRPGRHRGPARRARAGRHGHERAGGRGVGVRRRVVPVRRRPVAGQLPAHRVQAGLRHRGPRRRAAGGPGPRGHPGRHARGRRCGVRAGAEPVGSARRGDGDGDGRRHRGDDGDPDARRRRHVRRAHAADARPVHADVRARRATRRRPGPSIWPPRSRCPGCR